MTMNPQAVAAAELQLKKAMSDLQDLRDATNAEDADTAWREIVTRMQKIYNKLFDGAKASSEGQNWANAKKIERSNDELLNYAHQSRHADDHTIKAITQPETTKELVLPEGGFRMTELMLFDDGTMKTDAVFYDGQPVTQIGLRTHHLALCKIVNRGVTYEVPIMHRGQLIDHRLVPNVAQLILTYLEEIISEARALIK